MQEAGRGRRGRKCESTFHSILISEFHLETWETALHTMEENRREP